MLDHQDFGSSEAVLKYIQERSEDIERVVIPQVQHVWVSDPSTQAVQATQLFDSASS